MRDPAKRVRERAEGAIERAEIVAGHLETRAYDTREKQFTRTRTPEIASIGQDKFLGRRIDICLPGRCLQTLERAVPTAMEWDLTTQTLPDNIP